MEIELKVLLVDFGEDVKSFKRATKNFVNSEILGKVNVDILCIGAEGAILSIGQEIEKILKKHNKELKTINTRRLSRILFNTESQNEQEKEFRGKQEKEFKRKLRDFLGYLAKYRNFRNDLVHLTKYNIGHEKSRKKKIISERVSREQKIYILMVVHQSIFKFLNIDSPDAEIQKFFKKEEISFLTLKLGA